MSEDLHIDNEKVAGMGDELLGHVGVLRPNEGGLDGNVPDVPFDAFGLQAKIVQLVEARQGFEQRLNRLLEHAGTIAVAQAVSTTKADR